MLVYRQPRSGAVAVWLLLGLTLAVIALWLTARLVSDRTPLPVLGRVTGFQFTNQDGRAFESRQLDGMVWVADLIFTRCPGPCPRMTRNLARLQAAVRSEERVRLVTLTADPENDTPTVLRAYGEQFGADFRRWEFLTGPRAHINDVAIRQLLLAVADKAPAERESENDLFLHSTKWVVVDRKGQLRAVHEGSEPGAVAATRRDVRKLLREP